MGKASRDSRGWALGLAGGLLLLAVCAFNPSSDAAAPGQRLAVSAFPGPVKADVVRVIDGDTFEAAARIWLGEAITIHVRIEGIDAPELHAHCRDERRRAEAARDYLADRIEGGEVELTGVRYDKYGGRVDAVVRDGRGDIAEAMIRQGYARPYHGGRRRPWCART